MLENFLISITGKQEMDGETGEINLTTLGSYVQKGDKRFIVYKEYADSEEKPRTSILKVEKDGKVTLMHSGDATRLVLEAGKRHFCQYDTGYGSLMVGVFTSDVQTRLCEKGGDLKIHYTLDINASLSSRNEISVTVKEAGQESCQN